MRAREPVWIYGLHAVAAALANPARHCRRILVTAEAAKTLTDSLDLAQLDGARLDRPTPEIVTRRDIDEALPGTGDHGAPVHQGAAVLCDALAPADLHDVLAGAAAGAIVLVLDQPADPRNVGAVLRSAAAFGAAAVVVPDRHAPEATGVVAKAASGGLDRVPLVRAANLARALDQLKAAGFWCVGLAADAPATLAGAARFDKTALVLGSEGGGLRRLTAEKCDLLAHIPMAAEVGSLNLSAAAAIALYELRRK